MELAEARAVLGIDAGDDWSIVRAAYRERIRLTHPDIAGPSGNDLAVDLNAAYRALALARRDGRLHEVAAPVTGTERPAPHTPAAGPRAVPTEWANPTGTPSDLRLIGDDTIVLSSTPAETFRRLVEAAHAIGVLSYVDRSSAIFEAVVTLDDGTHASLVVSLQWRAHDATCEAFCTLEALERAEALDVRALVDQLCRFIPPDADEGSAFPRA